MEQKKTFFPLLCHPAVVFLLYYGNAGRQDCREETKSTVTPEDPHHIQFHLFLAQSIITQTLFQKLHNAALC